MTDEELTHLEKLFAEATPGPWRYDDGDIRGEDHRLVIQIREDAIGRGDPDVALIIAMYGAAPALFEELRRLRAFRDTCVAGAVAREHVDAVGPNSDDEYSHEKHVAALSELHRIEEHRDTLIAAERAR